MFVLCVSVCVFSGCSKEFDLQKFSKNLSTYNMDITYFDDHKLEVCETLEYVNNTSVSLPNIKLHIYPKDFCEGRVNSSVVSSLNYDKAYYNGVSYASIDFSKILVNSKECNYTFENEDENILNILFDKNIAPNDKITIYFEYSITLPNINHRFGYGENTINVSNFYPIVSVYENGDFDMDSYHYNGDPFYSDFANYNVSVTVPSVYTLVSSGVVDSVTDLGETKTYNISAIAIRDFAFIMSDSFEVKSTTIDGVTVSYYYYSNTFADECLETSVRALATFKDLFGDYPYSTLNVVEANFVHGGMEYPNLVYISDSVVDKADYLNVIVAYADDVSAFFNVIPRKIYF